MRRTLAVVDVTTGRWLTHIDLPNDCTQSFVSQCIHDLSRDYNIFSGEGYAIEMEDGTAINQHDLPIH